MAEYKKTLKNKESKSFRHFIFYIVEKDFRRMNSLLIKPTLNKLKCSALKNKVESKIRVHD